jgi:hypothetical protein
MDIFPAEPFTSGTSVALSSAIAGDPMADATDATKLLDVQMDYLAGMFALVAAYWLGGLERNKLVQPQPVKDATDGRWRYARLKSNLFACPPLTPKGGNSLYNRLRRRPMQAMWSGTAITQTSDALSAIAGQPLANRARADAYGFTDGLRRLPALRLPHNPLSTPRR